MAQRSLVPAVLVVKFTPGHWCHLRTFTGGCSQVLMANEFRFSNASFGCRLKIASM